MPWIRLTGTPMAIGTPMRRCFRPSSINARVILAPDRMGELQPGEILVVHTTDVGWTPLFLIATGVVTELGGPLSHAAVVDQ